MRAKAYILPLLLLLMASCATTGPRMVDSYEVVTSSLSMSHVFLTTLERDGALKGDKLIDAKAIYNKAREIYLQAGDILIAMYKFPKDPVNTQNRIQLYNRLIIESAHLVAGLMKQMEGGK